jgi:DNA-binding MarR family transcriptional regulator
MNIIVKIFKRKQINQQRENYKRVKQKLSENQDAVYTAVALIGYPCTGRQVARFLGWDSASVTPRLAELVKKDRIYVADVKRGLDKKYRKLYATKHF